MYGFPKRLATRADVDLLMTYLGTDWGTDDTKARGVAMLQGLIDDAQRYFFDRELTAQEQPDGPEPLYKVVTDDDGTRRQLKLQDDPTAMILHLGLTVAEAQNMMQTIQGAQ